MKSLFVVLASLSLFGAVGCASTGASGGRYADDPRSARVVAEDEDARLDRASNESSASRSNVAFSESVRRASSSGMVR